MNDPLNLAPASAAVDMTNLKQVRERLLAWFTQQLPAASHIEISELRMPGSGTSNETFFFTLDKCENGQQTRQNLVVRWPPSGFLIFPEDSYDMSRQFQLLHTLMPESVPTPPVFWMETDASVIGAPFYIMERVDGWVPGDFPPYHVEGPLFDAAEPDRAVIWNSAVEAIAAIHQLDWRALGLDFLGVPSGADFMLTQVAYYDRVFAQNAEPLPPILAKARQWLLDNRFAPAYTSLCWGDARLGNMVFNGHKVAAILDWEMACIGDPDADLAWFAHIDWASSEGRSSGPLARMAGLPSIAQTLAHYQKITGRKVSNFDYYDVFATWRMAMIYTRIEQDQRYLTRTGRPKGAITRTHFEKLERLLG